MKKSSVDQLFFELYGFYPNKSGQAFEMIVAAAFKLLLDTDIEYDQRLRGEYSKSVYQLDAFLPEDSTMIEAKDYTILNKKVGRGDVQKLQGALSDLSVEKGLFASATDFTSPAKKYADSSEENPLHKQIDLFHIRPSTVEDENGRIKKIIIDMSMHFPDYENAKMQFIWTKEGAENLTKDGHAGKTASFGIDRLFDKDGNTLITIHDLTKNHPPGTTWEKEFVAKGCWDIRNGYLKFENKLYLIRGIEYEIPYRIHEQEIVVESEGSPRLFIKNGDGTINKLITDQDLKKVKFMDGKVIVK